MLAQTDRRSISAVSACVNRHTRDSGYLLSPLKWLDASVTRFPLSRTVVRKIHVMPAEAGIQRLKSLDPGQNHAGMTIVE